MKSSYSRLARCTAGAVAATLIWGSLASAASAATTALSDVPIASKVTAKPNIVYTVDDSGSMTLPYIPDFTWQAYCRNGTAAANCLGTATGNLPASSTAAGTWTTPPLVASEFNHLAYNPDVTYTPPLLSDGTVLAGFKDQNAANTTNWTRVQVDPYLSPATVTNLTGTVNVPLYCNSDWPTDTVLHPTVSGGETRYDQDTGNGHCRINGTSYPVDASTGAPAVVDDYNYPWQNTAAPSDAKYFYLQLANKRIWCDRTSPDWPSTTSCVTGCAAGSPINTTYPQTWVKTGDVSGCVGPTTWSPAGCNTSTTYCSPGLGIPPECTPGCSSSCPTGVTGETGTCGYDPGTGRVVTGTKSCAGAGCTAVCANVTILTGCTIGSPSSVCTTNPAAASNCTTQKLADGVTTLLADANGAGKACRHNNQTYAVGGVAGLFKYPGNYPGEGTGSGNFNSAITAGCPATPTVVAIPRHYYSIDSVQFCDTRDATVNGQWKGFGTGACQSKNDLTTFKFVKYGQFHRTDLKNDGRTFAYKDIITGTPGTRTYAQEMTNYANWFAFYRTRILAAKTVSATAFAYLDAGYRVGFHTLNTPDTAWLDVNDFTAAQRSAWNTKLFAINVSNGNTPTLDAMLRIGSLFETGGSGGMTTLESGSLPAGVPDPITLTCQSNFHILFTDGYTHQTNVPALLGASADADATEPASFPAGSTSDEVLPQMGPRAGAAWYRPFVQQTVVPNSLSDIATYYWANDLRPAMKNDVPSWPGVTTPPLVYPKKEGDGDWEIDVAWWQHLNFSAISFGAEGILDASRGTAEVTDIMNGTKNWPAPKPPNDPKIASGAPADGAPAVDDLWHATVNSRGKFVYANAPIEVAQGLASILSGISNSRKGRIGATFGGNQVLDPSNNTVYRASIEAGWGGNLTRIEVDPSTVGLTATDWQARTALQTQLTPSGADPEPWFTNRRIVTKDTSGTAVPFRHPLDPGASPGSLDATQLATLSPNVTQQRKIVAYLRGGSTFAGSLIEGTSIGQFRKRSSLLGDINQSQPVIVGPPPAEVSLTTPTPIFSDTNDPGYSAFWNAHQTRAKRVYVGANDGMLHSFDADDGHEVFAYVPRAVIRNTVDVNGKPDGIQALTYQDGGVPIFRKHSYVDGPISTADVDFGGGNWHTILVGGLGKGGNTYYALDITDPDAADESAAASKVLWEFSDPDLAYSYSKPIIAKTYAFGWTVIVATGYNNPSGVGKIFFIDPKTGAKLATLSTSFGTPGSPSGLAQISGFTKDYHNQFIEQIYGGDLYGNLWRFDIHDPAVASWTVTKLAKLTDKGGGAVQPITTAPQIEIDFANGEDRYVFVGTGQLLDISDFTNPSPQQQQTLYAIRDGNVSTPDIAAGTRVRADFAEVLDKDGLPAASATGWLFDLPVGPNERIVTPIEADLNVVAFAGTQAQNDPCVTSLPADLYALEFATGRSVLLDSGGGSVQSIYSASGAVGVTLVSVQTSEPNDVPTLKLVYTPEQVDQPLAALNLQSPVIGGGHRFWFRYLPGQ